MENLVLADQKASKGKAGQYGVQIHAQNTKAGVKMHSLSAYHK